MDAQPSSSSKLDESETPPADAETKTLTNIYYDCLERIFDFLDLESLLNVAGTCKRLQIAAAAKFGDDFGGGDISLFPLDSSNRFDAFKSAEYSHIRVYGMKMCLPFLRCFGAKISELTVWSAGECIANYEYINRYCADTLTYIFFIHEWTKFSPEAFSKPFKSAECVAIRAGNLNDQLTNYARWFPNVRDLNISDHTDVRYTTAVQAVSFPQLEKLHFSFFNSKNKIFTTKNIVEFLHANRQLQNVELKLNLKMTFQEFIGMFSVHESITKIFVHDHIACGNVDELNQFADEHPQIRKLYLWRCIFDGDDAITLIRRLKSLKRFEFRLEKQSHSNGSDHFLRKLDNEWQTDIYDNHAFYSIKLFT